MRRDDQLALAAHAHREHALIPPADDATAPDREHERRAPIMRAVELRAVLQPAGVVHADRIAGRRSRTLSLDQIDVTEAGGRLDYRFVHGCLLSRAVRVATYPVSKHTACGVSV